MDIKKIQSNNNGGSKGKLFLLLGIFVLLIVGVFAFLFLGGDNEEKKKTVLDIKKLSEIVYVNESNSQEIQLIDYKEGKVISKLDLSSYKGENTPIYTMNDEYNKVYIINGKNLLTVSKDKEGKLKEKVILEDAKLLNASKLFVNENKLLISLNSNDELLRFNTDTNQFLEPITVQGEVSQATEIDGYVYYVIDNKLSKHHIKTNAEESFVGLIDKPTDMKVINNKIYILSPFGSGLDNSLLLRINEEEMLVETLLELEAGQSSFISEYRNSDKIYIATKNEAGKNTIQTYATTKIMDKDNEEETSYYLSNAKEINGLILSVTDEGLKINGIELKDISYTVKGEKPYFFNIIN